MAFQGMVRDVDGHGGKVVFPFGGQVYEVQLPPAPYYKCDCDAARCFMREEAATVLQCLTSRAALEQQRALAAAGLAGVPGIDVPPFLSELHGSFADLVQQLQECVDRRRCGLYNHTAPWGLLIAAARLCHASAAQQLLLFDPWIASEEPDDSLSPAHQAAWQRHGGAVLKLLLAAAPGLVQPTCEDDDTGYSWTLMHTVASSGNVEGIRLLLQLAPELATAATDTGSTPLHVAASGGSAEAVRLLLEAAPATAAAADSRGWLPMHAAAGCRQPDALRVLLEAGAPGVDVVAEGGSLPLHIAFAPFWSNETSVRLLLDASPAAALVKDSEGRTPLHAAASNCTPAAVELLMAANPAAVQEQDSLGRLPLHYAAGHKAANVQLLLAAYPAAIAVTDHSGRMPLHLAANSINGAAVRLLLHAYPAAALVRDKGGRMPLQLALNCLAAHPLPDLHAARALLPASGLSAAQLLDLLAAAPVRAQPLYADLAAHLPLTLRQWLRVPVPCSALVKALPAVLARSQAEAALLLTRLPAMDTERLRVAALSLHRVQHRIQQILQIETAVPAALVGRILALALAGSEV